MGELARRRRARDLWISRGHLAAASVAVVIAVATSFFLGVAVGTSTSDPAPDSTASAFRAGIASDDLVALLARVEASAEVHAGVDRLTFPEALVAQPAAAEIVVPEAPVGAVVEVRIAPGSIQANPSPR